MSGAASTNSLQLSEGLTVEDTGDAFFLIIAGDGHDMTLSLDNDVALRLAEFIASRRASHR